MSYQVVPIGASIPACGFVCSQGCIFKRSSLSVCVHIFYCLWFCVFPGIYFQEVISLCFCSYILLRFIFLFQHTVIDMSELGIVI